MSSSRWVVESPSVVAVELVQPLDARQTADDLSVHVLARGGVQKSEEQEGGGKRGGEQMLQERCACHPKCFGSSRNNQSRTSENVEAVR